MPRTCIRWSHWLVQVLKYCPTCHKVNNFYAISSVWPANPQQKSEIMALRRDKMATRPCPYKHGDMVETSQDVCPYRHSGGDPHLLQSMFSDGGWDGNKSMEAWRGSE